MAQRDEELIKALIFDIDMTICDTRHRKRKAVERALGTKLTPEAERLLDETHGFVKALRAMHIEPSDEVMKKIAEHFFYDRDLFELDKPLEGAVETLRTLSKMGYSIYYLTGRPLGDTAKAFLAKYGFPQGKVLWTKVGPRESYKKIALFKRILEEEGLSPHEVVSVGDLPGDAEAAKAVGIIAVGTCQGTIGAREALEKVCDYVIGHISEIFDVLKAIEKRRC